LYNILWLSTKIDKWTDAGNKEYIRRFQIPTRVIEHHFSNPEKLDNDRIRLEKEKQSFPGDITMPEDDGRDFKTALNGQLEGIRNILPLIGIMALRYEKAGDDLVAKKIWKEAKIKDADYEEMEGMLSSDADQLTREHLFKEQIIATKKKNPFQKGEDKSVGGNPKNKDEDTIETRAKAWFKAYAAWKYYSKVHPVDDRIDDAGKFEADIGSPDE